MSQRGQKTSPEEDEDAIKELEATHLRRNHNDANVERFEMAQKESRREDDYNQDMLKQAREKDDLQREFVTGLKKIPPKEN